MNDYSKFEMSILKTIVTLELCGFYDAYHVMTCEGLIERNCITVYDGKYKIAFKGLWVLYLKNNG